MITKRLIFLTFLLLTACQSKKAEKKPALIPAIKVTQAISASVPLYIETIGHMEAYKTVNIMAQADGFLLTTHFKDGADVKEGELLYSIDPRPYLADLQLADGQLKEQIAELGYAERTTRRNTPLVKDNYISQDDYDSLKTTVVADRALVEQSLANVETASINLGFTTIYSPLDARAGFSLVKDGNLVLESAETTLVTLNQITPIYSTFFIPGKQFPSLQRHQKKSGKLKVIITVDDPTSPSVYEGILTFIDNQIDLATGMIELKATFKNEEKELWPNQYVKVKLILDTLKDAVLIPVSAAKVSDNKKIVFILSGKNKVKSQVVTLGQRQRGDWLVVTSGVKAGDLVVTDGQINLYDGAKVTVVDEEGN